MNYIILCKTFAIVLLAFLSQATAENDTFLVAFRNTPTHFRSLQKENPHHHPLSLQLERIINSNTIRSASVSNTDSKITSNYTIETFKSQEFNDAGLVMVSFSSDSGINKILSSSHQLEFLEKVSDETELTFEASESTSPIIGSGDADTYSWSLDRIDQHNLPLDHQPFKAWENEAGVDVYVLDSGINSKHMEFRINPVSNESRVMKGINILPDQAPEDADDTCLGHGTFVASQIGGNTVGVARKSTLIPIRVIGCQGKFSVLNIMKGLDMVMVMVRESQMKQQNKNITKINLPVVNISGRAFGKSNAFDAAVVVLIQAGIPVIVASGNERGRNSCEFSPNTRSKNISTSDYTLVVSGSSITPKTNMLSTTSGGGSIYTPVTTTTTTNFPGVVDTVPQFANIGPCVDVFAPCENIRGASYMCPTCFSLWSGTSFSTPLVTGFVASLRAYYPHWSPFCIREAIIEMSTENVVFIPPSPSNETTMMTTPSRMLFIPSLEYLPFSPFSESFKSKCIRVW